ncbi:single-stranded DNA binding protein [Microbacterium phage Magritte]|nr:single-stranded DNA binding protein [Microbacterium phage Magritte]
MTMGRVAFTSENKKSTNNFDFPKLKLTQGEKARIVVGLEDPVVEYVHTLRKPQIVNGTPQMETLKRRDGSEYQGYKKDFVGTPLCEGREEVLDDKGLDKDQCPMCALAAENSDYTDAPRRRYAMHVMRYRTKGNTDQVATPFSVELVVWSFTDKIFAKLVDIRNDIEGGDLRKHDIVLGPCTNPTFQQFDITPSLKKAEWMADKERGKIFAETWKENQIPDLTIAIGNRKKEEWIKQDIETIREAWAEVRAYESGDSSTSLDADLSGLLDEDPKDKDGWSKSTGLEDDGLGALLDSTDTKEETSDDDTDDLLASIGGAPAEDETTEAPAEEPKKAARKTATKKEEPAAESTGVDNFDDLLSEMS